MLGNAIPVICFSYQYPWKLKIYNVLYKIPKWLIMHFWYTLYNVMMHQVHYALLENIQFEYNACTLKNNLITVKPVYKRHPRDC